MLQDTWSFFYPQTGPVLPRKALVQETRTTDYGPTGGSKTTSVTYQYDAYANTTQVFSHGEVTAAGAEIPNDELKLDLTPRAPDTARYLVDRVRLAEEREQRGAGFVLLSSVETTHNASGDPELVKTAVLPGSTVVQRSVTYDSSTGNLLTTTSELGGLTRISAYDPDNLRPQTVTNPAGETTTIHWHPLCGQPIDTTDANQVTTTASYDPLCRPKRTDLADGGFAIRSYLDTGNPQSQRIRTETPGKNGNDYAEAYLNGFGRTYRTRKRGPSAGKDILTERSFNERGSVATETAPFYEGEDSDATEYGYDAFDRLTKTTAPDGKETTHSYELWKETTTDPKTREVTVERTVTSSTETKTVEGEEVRTKRTLDLLGRLRELRDNENNLWSWSYDSLGRTLRQVDPDAGSWTWAYNDAARTQTQTDAKGQQVTTMQDISGRIAWKSSGVGSTSFRYGEAREGYKNAGRLTSVLSPGTSLEVDYDALGRVARQKRTIGEAGGPGTPAQSFTMSYAYDTAGRVRQTTYPDGTVAGPMGYDEAGRFVSIPGGLLNATYDAAGRPLVQTNANGTVTTRRYVPKRGVLDTLVTTHPTTGTIQSLNYDYDPDVPLVSQIQSPVAGESWQYGYDTGDRLKTATNLSNPADSQTFTYDALDRIKTNSRIGIYEYPLPGQPRPHAPKTAGAVTYFYDNNGNLTSGGGPAPVWDGENRITSIGTTQFSYDTAGERVKKVSPAGVSLYPFGDDYEVTNGVVTKYLGVDGLGVIAKQVTGGPDPGLFWLHTDRLGSIQAVTSGQTATRTAGTVVFRRTYRPYGETLGQGGAHTESRGWIDQRNDGETGLTYLHARYYDSRKGVFLSPDPIGVAGGMNLYGYAVGDPINLSDPTGLWPHIGQPQPPPPPKFPSSVACAADGTRTSSCPGYPGFGSGSLFAEVMRRQRTWTGNSPAPWAGPGRKGGSAGGKGSGGDSGGGSGGTTDDGTPAELKRRHERCSTRHQIPVAPPRASLPDNLWAAEGHAENYQWFYDQVRNGGEWDYKQDGAVYKKRTGYNPYEDFGNFNFGATGRAAGIPPWILQRAAGWAQMVAHTSQPEFGHFAFKYPYGDDFADQAQIMAGIDYTTCVLE